MHSKEELKSYQQKSKMVLQQKEEFINNLIKQNENPSDPDTVSQNEFLLIAQEKTRFENETKEKAETIERLQQELSELREQMSEMSGNVEMLERSWEEEKQRREKSEKSHKVEMLERLNEITNLKKINEEQNQSHINRQSEKEKELESLRTQLSSKQNVSSNQEELERRIQQITEHLIQKQNQLEMALSEKASLQFQLESSFQKQIDMSNHSFEESFDLNDSLPTTRTFQRRGQKTFASFVDADEVNEHPGIKGKVMRAAKVLDSVK